MASTYLSKTFAQAGNRRTFTISYWIKMGQVSTGADQAIMGAAQDGSNSDDLYIHTGRLNFSGYYGSTAYQVRTTAKYRDLSGWYHHVIRFDSTQSTASDRLRLYVNGELQTALDSNTYPSQNLETTYFNTARQHTIGSIAYGVPNLAFNGSMSHFHFCDGYSYGADSFGETDSTTGEWKIKTSPSVSYGTNGFFILKDGNSVTDQSGQGNNWSVGGGTLTKTEDCPSNVFATWNPLDRWVGGTFTGTNGNTTVRGSDSHNTRFGCTLAVTSGKYYWEVKAMESVTHGGTGVGIASIPDTHTNSSSWFGNSSYALIFQTLQFSSNTLKTYVGGNTDSYTGNISVGDIINFALDMDNSGFYIGINGSWLNSGDPTSGSSKTGAINTGTNANSFFGNMSGKTIMPVGNVQHSDYIQSNFGND
ncbi:hypothetical protein P200_gp035 [Pelagibacter phage HTVC200P]|nr:hypothetical protein P200_gp035 [Pelagibacter phage HTVC200P]